MQKYMFPHINKSSTYLALQNSIINQLGPPTVPQMTTVSIQQQSSNCNRKCIFNIASQFIRADCICCVSSGSRSMTNWQFLETTFLKTDWEYCFHSLSIMMLNLINIKLETEITLFLNNLCNMLSGRGVLGQVFRKCTPFIDTWCLYLHFSSIIKYLHTQVLEFTHQKPILSKEL